MTTTIVILNSALSAAVVGAIVGLLLYAIKTSPTDANASGLAHRWPGRQARRGAARVARPRGSGRPVLDR